MQKIISGKVRDVYEINDNHLVIVTTDRISAFDVILSKPVKDKGKVLNALSLFGLIIRKILSKIMFYPISSRICQSFSGTQNLRNAAFLLKSCRYYRLSLSLEDICLETCGVPIKMEKSSAG